MDQDGIDPSDALATLHTRKATVFYWSFLELGPAALQCEQAWMTLALSLQGPMKSATDGIAQLSVICCRELRARFESGLDLDLPNGASVTIFAKIACFVGDEPALKEMTSCKGHSGQKPCALCLNAVSERQPGTKKADADDRPGLWAYSANLKSIAEVDFSVFKSGGPQFIILQWITPTHQHHRCCGAGGGGRCFGMILHMRGVGGMRGLAIIVGGHGRDRGRRGSKI